MTKAEQIKEFIKEFEKILIRQVESDKGLIYMVPKVSSLFSKALDTAEQRGRDKTLEKIEKGGWPIYLKKTDLPSSVEYVRKIRVQMRKEIVDKLKDSE